MTVQTDDVNLKIKLVLSDVDKQKKPGKVPGQARGGKRAARREPEKEKARQARGKRGIDSRGIGLDLLQGRRPGAGRFGRTGSRVAGLLGLLVAVDLAGPSLIGAGTALTPFASEETKRLAREEAVKIWNASGGAILAGIQASIQGAARTTSNVSGLILAGVKLTPKQVAAMAASDVEIAFREAQIERAKRSLGQVEVGAAGVGLAKAGASELLDFLWDVSGLEDRVGNKMKEVLIQSGLLGPLFWK